MVAFSFIHTDPSWLKNKKAAVSCVYTLRLNSDIVHLFSHLEVERGFLSGATEELPALKRQAYNILSAAYFGNLLVF